MSRRRRPDQAGLTLVELMVSLVIAGIVVSMVLGIHGRMTTAYRGQAQVSELSNTLRAARGRLISDVRQAGFMIADGFCTAANGAPTAVVSPVQIVNGSDAADQLTVYFGDARAIARVTALDPDSGGATMSDVGGFAVGDDIVLVNPRLEGGDSSTSAVAKANACIVRITSIDAASVPPRLEFDSLGAPVNQTNNPQCSDVAAETTDGQTVALPLAARTYRIDPNRLELGVLQLSTVAFGSHVWSDLAVGVVNLQLATRYYEAGDGNDLDVDGDEERDWYSGDAQNTSARGTAVPLSISISLEARTLSGTGAVTAKTSSELTDSSSPPDSVLYNSTGDWPAVDLTADDDERPAAYRGDHLFRSSTTAVDLRNLGVGR